ncbi:MAG: FAD:protein FMN transferase [Rhodoferax sp.]|uniref:FAD:protein FMN transferase n=1 Tax=Rhodoferax sp. TaxID=50421 RepID=UPI0026165E81|nr:FAD:protein FMN transferase [Rhodoferax sp.]MDD2879900.1 FAD:protein FMN transferase [Rhodoferax sp.]
MKRRTFLQTSLGLGVAVAAQVGLATGQIDRPKTLGAPVWRTRPVLGFGTNLSLLVAHTDQALAESALDTAVADIRHVEAQMSLFNPQSALSQLNAQGFLAQPHPDFLKVLQLAKAVSEKSHGAFDVTVQPLWAVFSEAQALGRLPTAEAVALARQRTGWQHVVLSPARISFTQPNMAITLNGIAQGFAADLVQAHWRHMGIEHALINTGEWAALGKSQMGGDWRLGIANPRDEQKLMKKIALHGRSVATSADSQTFFSPDFKHHHIFNPHTGYSPLDVASVTVAADSCALADALTKVMFVAGMDQAMVLAKAWAVEVLVVDKAGKWRATPGFEA